MRSLIFDTDILSTFGKLNKLDLLRKLFPETTFNIPTSVYNELFKAKDCGYEFVDHIIESQIFKVTPLSQEEVDFLEKLRHERRSLGAGDSYDADWLIVVEPSNLDADLTELIHGDDVKPWLEEELA